MRTVPLVNTRALGNAFLVQKPAMGQPSTASPARAALEEAKRVHGAMGARYEDLVALLGRTKADIMVGQAALAVEAAKAALNA